MALETYEGNNGKTKVRDDFPDSQWINIGDNQRLSNVVLESATLKSDTKHGEAIFVFCHDADTGELYATTFGMAIGQSGKRGTVYSRSAVETLLKTHGEDGITDPEIKPAFVSKRIWIGKTTIAGKTWKAFECDFMSGEPKFDSSYRGEDDEIIDDITEDKHEIDISDEVNVYILEALDEGKDALTISREVEKKFSNFTSNAAVKRVVEVKKGLE